MKTKIDKAVHPGVQSSFSMRTLIDKARCISITSHDSFKNYVSDVLDVTKKFSTFFKESDLYTGGTDKHYFVLNTKTAFGLSGFEAELRLENVGILTNRQIIPNDESFSMASSSAIRIGTPWMVSKGFTNSDLAFIYATINEVLSHPSPNENYFNQVKTKVQSLCLTKSKIALTQ